MVEVEVLKSIKIIEINSGMGLKTIVPALHLPDKLTSEQKFKLITLMHESYYNTVQDTDTFATEFYSIVERILTGVIPLEAEYLLIEDIYEEIADILKG